MGRPRLHGKCSELTCERQAISKGLCAYHYNIQRIKADPTKANSGLRGHPYYVIWFERKKNNDLVSEWLDFKTFIKDVGVKPEGNYHLVRPDWNKPYGPDNFAWYEKLARMPGETAKQFHARKWQYRRIRNPKEEYNRNLVRNYGITIDDYEEKLKLQNNVCAICKKLETHLTKSGEVKKLALDHCHNSKKLRDLLCTRCNRVLGSVNDSVELLQEMIVYLNKHKET